MCGPAAIPIMLAASTALSAGSMIVQGVNAKKMGAYENAQAQENAKAAENQAHDARERGKKTVADHYRQVAALRSKQNAGFASLGLDVGLGAPADIIGDTDFFGNQDADILRDNIDREAQGFQIDAANYRASGAMAKAKGSAAFTSSLISAGGTILDGASQIGAHNYKNKKPA